MHLYGTFQCSRIRNNFSVQSKSSRSALEVQYKKKTIKSIKEVKKKRALTFTTSRSQVYNSTELNTNEGARGGGRCGGGSTQK